MLWKPHLAVGGLNESHHRLQLVLNPDEERLIVGAFVLLLQFLKLLTKCLENIAPFLLLVNRKVTTCVSSFSFSHFRCIYFCAYHEGQKFFQQYFPEGHSAVFMFAAGCGSKSLMIKCNAIIRLSSLCYRVVVCLIPIFELLEAKSVFMFLSTSPVLVNYR